MKKAKSKLANPEHPPALAGATGSEIDVEVVVRTMPSDGLSRHFGGVVPGTRKDNAAIAAALHKIADGLSPNVKLSHD